MNGSQKNWIEIMSQWMRLQQTFWKEWITFTQKSMQSVATAVQPDPGEEAAFPWNIYQNWFESFRKLYQEKDGEGIGPTVFNRMLSASRVYLDLLNFWSKALSSFKEVPIGEPLTTEKINAIRQQWIQYYQSMMESLWGGLPSADMRDTAKALTSSTIAASDFMWSFIEPSFKNMSQLPEVMERVAKGDRGAVAELGGIFLKNYEETIGKALLAPSVGYFREFNERLNNMTYSFLQFNTAKASFYTLFYDTGIRAAERVYEKYTEFVGKEITPETFREFYRIWWTINEEVYQDLFRSEEFAKLSREVTTRGLQFRKWVDDLLEQILKFTSLPSKKDMDEIYQSLYELKKDARNQKRAIKDIERHLGVGAVKNSPSQ